jgi:THO complex subunit 3
MNTMTCVRTIDRLEYPVRSISWSSDSQYIATASDDKVVDISRASDAQRVRAIHHSEPVSIVSWTPGRGHLLAFAVEEGKGRGEEVGAGTIRLMAAP